MRNLKQYLYAITIGLMLAAFSAAPAFALTEEEAVEWLNSQIGTRVGNGQCVELAKKYYELFGASASGDGKDYINNVPDSTWVQIKYTGTPLDVKTGDVCVWATTKWTDNEGTHFNEYGHVGIVSQMTADGFEFYHQNPDPVAVGSFNYGREGWEFLGIVRPPINGGIALPDGTYCLANKQYNMQMNVFADSIARAMKETPINLYQAIDDDTQKFTIEYSDEAGGYLICPKGSSLTLNLKEAKSGTPVYCYTKGNRYDAYWIIEARDDGYALRLADNPSLYLTATGNKGKMNSQELAVSEDSGSDSQIFYFIEQ